MAEVVIDCSQLDVDPDSIRLQGGEIVSATFSGQPCRLTASARMLLTADLHKRARETGFGFRRDPAPLLLRANLIPDIGIDRVRQVIERIKGKKYLLGPMIGRNPDEVDYFIIEDDIGIYEAMSCFTTT